VNDEIGYQYLNTSFTGTNSISSCYINSDLLDFFLPSDMGVAASLTQFELKSYFDNCK